MCKRKKKGSSARRLGRVKGAIAHPVRTIKDRSNNKAAAKVAAARPVVPKGNDREFLEAQRRVEERDGGDGDGEAVKGEGEDAHEDEAQEEDVKRLNELMGQRDSLRVAWTMDEGVMRAVAVDRRRRALPTVGEFERVDADGNEEVQWREFAGTVSFIFLSSPLKNGMKNGWLIFGLVLPCSIFSTPAGRTQAPTSTSLAKSPSRPISSAGTSTGCLFAVRRCRSGLSI